MNLHFKKYGTQGKPLIILHGFLGSLDNWHTLATELGKQFTVYAIDQRNHGKSPHTNEHSLNLMVADVFEFMQQQNLQTVSLLGHSMGGKIAMQFALENENKVEKLIVADIAPRGYKHGHDAIFKALFAVDLNKVSSRKDAENFMLDLVPEFSTRQFLLKNLERTTEGIYCWKMNLPVLFKHYEENIQQISYSKSSLTPTLFIKGELSNYIQQTDYSAIQVLFTNAQITTIAGAGHWVHADKPAEFLEVVRRFLTT